MIMMFMDSSTIIPELDGESEDSPIDSDSYSFADAASADFERESPYQRLFISTFKPWRVLEFIPELDYAVSSWPRYVRQDVLTFKPTLTSKARVEFAHSQITPWAVDEAVFSIQRYLRERDLVENIIVDAIQDPESPPPPNITITVYLEELTSERRFEIWDALAEKVENALVPWKPEHRIVVVVISSRGGKWNQENSTGLPQSL